MGQKICRGSRDGVITDSRRSQAMRGSGDPVVVDERLDTSQLPIRLPHISEDLNEDGYDSSNRGTSLNGDNRINSRSQPPVFAGTATRTSSVTLTRDVPHKDETAPILTEMREVDATPDEVAELDRSNVPISLDENMAITSRIQYDNNDDDDDEDMMALDKSNMPIVLDDPPLSSSVKENQDETSYSNGGVANSLQYEHDNSMLGEQQRRRNSSEKASFLEAAELDRSNMPIILDDPPIVEPKKSEAKMDETIIDEKKIEPKEEQMHEMNNDNYDKIVKSTSAGSMGKEERIEDSGFNKDVQLSPKSDSKLVVTSTSLNSLKEMNLNATDEASSEQEIKTDVATQIQQQQQQQQQSPKTQQAPAQEHNLVTNKTEKFAIMDLLAKDYMRNDQKSNSDKVDNANTATTNNNQGDDLKEPMLKEASSNASDSSLPLVQTEKFSVHENPEQNEAS